MTQNTSIPLPTQEEDARCRHHWVIQPAMGPESQGICQSCGEIRDFKNYVEGATWGDSRLVNRTNSKEAVDLSRIVGDQMDDEAEE